MSPWRNDVRVAIVSVPAAVGRSAVRLMLKPINETIQSKLMLTVASKGEVNPDAPTADNSTVLISGGESLQSMLTIAVTMVSAAGASM